MAKFRVSRRDLKRAVGSDLPRPNSRRTGKPDRNRIVLVKLTEPLTRLGLADGEIYRNDGNDGLEGTGETVTVWGLNVPQSEQLDTDTYVLCTVLYGEKQTRLVPLNCDPCPVAEE